MPPVPGELPCPFHCADRLPYIPDGLDSRIARLEGNRLGFLVSWLQVPPAENGPSINHPILVAQEFDRCGNPQGDRMILACDDVDLHDLSSSVAVWSSGCGIQARQLRRNLTFTIEKPIGSACPTHLRVLETGQGTTIVWRLRNGQVSARTLTILENSVDMLEHITLPWMTSSSFAVGESSRNAAVVWGDNDRVLYAVLSHSLNRGTVAGSTGAWNSMTCSSLRLAALPEPGQAIVVWACAGAVRFGHLPQNSGLPLVPTISEEYHVRSLDVVATRAGIRLAWLGTYHLWKPTVAMVFAFELPSRRNLSACLLSDKFPDIPEAAVPHLVALGSDGETAAVWQQRNGLGVEVALNDRRCPASTWRHRQQLPCPSDDDECAKVYMEHLQHLDPDDAMKPYPYLSSRVGTASYRSLYSLPPIRGNDPKVASLDSDGFALSWRQRPSELLCPTSERPILVSGRYDSSGQLTKEVFPLSCEEVERDQHDLAHGGVAVWLAGGEIRGQTPDSCLKINEIDTFYWDSLSRPRLTAVPGGFLVLWEHLRGYRQPRQPHHGLRGRFFIDGVAGPEVVIADEKTGMDQNSAAVIGSQLGATVYWTSSTRYAETITLYFKTFFTNGTLAAKGFLDANARWDRFNFLTSISGNDHHLFWSNCVIDSCKLQGTHSVASHPIGESIAVVPLGLDYLVAWLEPGAIKLHLHGRTSTEVASRVNLRLTKLGAAQISPSDSFILVWHTPPSPIELAIYVERV